MCGRFLQFSPPHLIAERFGVEHGRLFLPDLVTPQYNLAPSQQAMVVRLGEADGQRRLAYMTWGLLPHWAKESKFPFSTINARAETVQSKPAFRDSFRRRRCLVPCDGYYEWKPVGRVKQPYLIRLKEDGPFALAGLWDQWEGDGIKIVSFAIVVTDANALTRDIHDRMPVILDGADWARWLDPDTPATTLKGMLLPYDPGQMRYWPVSRRVGSPAINDPNLIQPIAA